MKTFYATLNSASLSDGSFCLYSAGCALPDELVTYFRINAENTGQFERTLINRPTQGSYVSYLRGCLPRRTDESTTARGAWSSIHHREDAEVKYSTVQKNWYPVRERQKADL